MPIQKEDTSRSQIAYGENSNRYAQVAQNLDQASAELTTK
jgi:hypothetical protein